MSESAARRLLGLRYREGEREGEREEGREIGRGREENLVCEYIHTTWNEILNLVTHITVTQNFLSQIRAARG